VLKKHYNLHAKNSHTSSRVDIVFKNMLFFEPPGLNRFGGSSLALTLEAIFHFKTQFGSLQSATNK